MKGRETTALVLILCSVVFASRYFLTHSTLTTGKNPTAISVDDRTKLLALVGTLESPLHLDAPVQSDSCTVQGPLPDHACSPGSVFLGVPIATICTSGYTKTVRNVSVSLKKKIYAEYGIAYPQPTGSYELDHLVPLELGGDNSAANLFPEAASPTPGFKEKDVVEDYLHEEVCAGNVSLASAQEQIADNWLAVYDLLSTSTIQSIKQQYHSWAD